MQNRDEYSLYERRIFNRVAYAHEKMKEKQMLTWLYDEDRWPSGYGGGYVTKDSRYRMRFLGFFPGRDEYVAAVKNDRVKNWQKSVSGFRSKKERPGSTGTLENH